MNNKLPLLILGIGASFMVSAQTKVAKRESPNVIFILTDDQRNSAMGYTGNMIIQTPEMDQLATDGVYFRNAFVTTPICAASRASILTGLYERTHGYTFQLGPLKEPYVKISYPLVLKNHGYHVGFFGKLGVTIKGTETIFDESDIYDRNDKAPNRKGYYFNPHCSYPSITN